MRDEYLVLIPRRVIGAACGALGRSDKKDCAALVDLRSYAFHTDATPQSSAPVVGDFARDVFRIAGGDVECCPNPTQEHALACLQDLRQCYDESLSRQGGEEAYDRELIAKMLDELEPVVGLQYIRESVANQARLLRAAENRDASGVHTVNIAAAPAPGGGS